MRCFIAFFFALTVSFFAFAENDSCSVVSFDNDDCPLKGRVKIVTSGSYDLKVRVFDGGSCDLYVKVFSTVGECHPDNECGEIAFVDGGSYDLSIRFEDKRSYQRYVDAMHNAKD